MKNNDSIPQVKIEITGNISKGKTDVYGSEFYQEQKSLSLSSAEAVVPLVCKQINPTSVIDFGCGVGTWLKVFTEKGITSIKGLELSELPDAEYLIDRSCILTGINFASEKFSVTSNAELAVCLEVAEHIHEKYAKTLISNLCRSAPAVLFSAACPGQTGVQHINEQPLSFWRRHFAQHGFKQIDCIRPHIQNNLNIAWWYRQNIVLFASKAAIDNRRDLMTLYKEYGTPENLQDSIEYVSEWVFEKQRTAMHSAGEILKQIGNQVIESGDYKAGLNILEIILEMQIKDENLYETLSNLCYHLGMKEKAQEYLQEAQAYKEVSEKTDIKSSSSTENKTGQNNSNLKVSVIIPTYNRANELADLLNSLCEINQSKEEFEILIIDNNSNDETSKVAESFKDKLPNLKYYFETTPGLHAARHRGLMESTNELLIFCDDDILPNPDWINGVRAAFADNSVQLVTGKIVPYYQHTPPDWLQGMWNKDHFGKSLGWLTLLDLGEEQKEIPAGYIWGANFAVRKQAVISAGGFHPDSMPPELLKYRGDGETGLARKIAEQHGKAIYHPMCNVLHKVPSKRMTLEYFHKRAFAQGISDSFTAVRKTKQLQPLRSIPTTKDNMDQFMNAAMAEGWNFHQNELRKDPSLFEWVIKNSYI